MYYEAKITPAFSIIFGYFNNVTVDLYNQERIKLSLDTIIIIQCQFSGNFDLKSSVPLCGAISIGNHMISRAIWNK